MKRFLSLALIAILIMGCMSVTAFAAEGVTISGTGTTVEAGQTASVSFSVGNIKYANFSFEFTYNSSVMTLTSVTAGGAAVANFGYNEIEPGKVRVNAAQNDEVETSGVIFTANFQTKSDAAEDTYPVNLSLRMMTNQANEPVNPTIDPQGYVKITAPKCEHVWGEYTVTKEAKCGVAGEKVATCTKGCGETDTQIIPALEHSFTDYVVTKEAKCGVAGEKVAECDHGCGETDTKTIPALEHSFTDYVVTKEAKCGVAGEKVAECDHGCGETDTKTIPALKHSFTKYTQTKAPTCTEKGEKTAYCDHGCGETDVKEIDALGHAWKTYKEDKDWLYQKCTRPGCNATRKIENTGVPGTGDITPMLYATGFGVFAMFAAVAYVFKRKFVR